DGVAGNEEVITITFSKNVPQFEDINYVTGDTIKGTVYITGFAKDANGIDTLILNHEGPTISSTSIKGTSSAVLVPALADSVLTYSSSTTTSYTTSSSVTGIETGHILDFGSSVTRTITSITGSGPYVLSWTTVLASPPAAATAKKEAGVKYRLNVPIDTTTLGFNNSSGSMTLSLTVTNTVGSGATTKNTISFSVDNIAPSALTYTGSGSAIGSHELKGTVIDSGTVSGIDKILLYLYNNSVFTAGSFKVGKTYTIVTPGTTNFVAIGAADSNVGTTFTATGVGSGTGTAQRNDVSRLRTGSATLPNDSDQVRVLTNAAYDDYRIVVDNFYEDLSDGGSNGDDDNFDEYLSRSGSNYNWQGNFSSSAVDDGTYTLYILAYDTAGNLTTQTQTLSIENNKPIISGITIGTDLTGDGDSGDTNETTLLSTADGYAASGFKVRNNYMTLSVTTTGGNTKIRSNFMFGTQLAVTSGLTDTASYTVAYIGTTNWTAYFNSITNPVAVGKTFTYSTSNTLSGTGTVMSGIVPSTWIRKGTTSLTGSDPGTTQTLTLEGSTTAPLTLTIGGPTTTSFTTTDSITGLAVGDIIDFGSGVLRNIDTLTAGSPNTITWTDPLDTAPSGTASASGAFYGMPDASGNSSSMYVRIFDSTTSNDNDATNELYVVKVVGFAIDNVDEIDPKIDAASFGNKYAIDDNDADKTSTIAVTDYDENIVDTDGVLTTHGDRLGHVEYATNSLYNP
ncbi:MAG: hypothetical protein Q8N15_01905, partial [Bacillota bacterium]|nr:hypothetical protein [Bacillota bacterium]